MSNYVNHSFPNLIAHHGMWFGTLVNGHSIDDVAPWLVSILNKLHIVCDWYYKCTVVSEDMYMYIYL